MLFHHHRAERHVRPVRAPDDRFDHGRHRRAIFPAPVILVVVRPPAGEPPLEAIRPRRRNERRERLAVRI